MSMPAPTLAYDRGPVKHLLQDTAGNDELKKLLGSVVSTECKALELPSVEFPVKFVCEKAQHITRFRNEMHK